MSGTEEIRQSGTLSMRPKRIRSVSLLVVAVALSLLGADITSQALDSSPGGTPQTPVVKQKTAEEVYKNIQVLNGLPASELDGVMLFMSAAMGVGCTHCHTNPWESDSKSTKGAARKMIAMTRAINKENFSGNPAITCFTCHRGQHNTEPQPLIDIAVNPAPDSTVPAKTALPPTDEVIDRYIRAIGGEVAIEKLKTRMSRGNETTTNRMTPPRTLPIEIIQASGDKLLIIRTDPRGVNQEGFDGANGWSKDERGQREMTGNELAGAKREADFFRYLKIRQSYPQMRVLGKEKVGDHEAYVVGATSREADRERLYFDAQSGLLVRKYVSFKTAFGSIPEVTDFDDYREVSGVKLPFRIKWSRPPFGFVREFSEIKLNVTVDATKFESKPR